MRRVGRMQHAGARIGHVRGYLRQLEVRHERLGRGAPAGHAEAHHAAGAVRQVLLRQLVLVVARQAGVAHPGDLRMRGQMLRQRQAVLAVLRHAQVQAFQPQVDEVGVLRRLDGAEVAHELGRRLRDERAAQAEALGVRHSVVALVGLAQAGELVGMRRPIELPGVHDGPAHAGAMAVHVLRGGVRHDVGAPLDGTAVHRRGERVVHDQRHPVRVRGGGEALDVEHRQRRIRDGLAEHGLRVRPERGLQLLVGAVGRNERAFQAHALHGHGQQVVRAAVDGRAGYDTIARAGDVEHGEEVRSLARRREHGRRAALELGDFGRHEVVRGVRQTRVEVPGLLEVEQAAHVLARVVLPGGGLVDGNLARLAVAGTQVVLMDSLMDAPCCGIADCALAIRLIMPSWFTRR